MPKFQKIGNAYEHHLAYLYHQIDHKGLLINAPKLEKARLSIKQELTEITSKLSAIWGFPVYIGAENKVKDEKALNINSPEKKLERLKELGYKVPKVRQKDEETHEYEYEESAGQLALQKLFADPSLWPKDPKAGEAIKLLLDSAKIITFQRRYLNARLYQSQFFSNYNVAGTTTGRRGSKKNLFGFGGNGQNFPARGRLADIWKELITARPGKIFFSVDQVSAEDWPVQALSENYVALGEMVAGINRHYKFASYIFGRSIDELKRGRGDRTSPLHEQCEMEYYFGKKGRHANNYGMQPIRLNESLAGEGFSIPINTCKHILQKVDEIDSNVKRIFHKYIQTVAYTRKLLTTPLGRERHVLGLRSGERNYAILNELYAYIPQSTIGDNTGLAITFIANEYENLLRENCIVQESHDSICQEVPDSLTELTECFNITKEAFNRTIRFHNGIEINIPIEGKLGYDWLNTVEIKKENFNEEGLANAYRELQEKYPRQKVNESVQSSEEKLAGLVS